ncbi:type ISP restriction/modification enzyme [Streptomyces sp. NPDC001985]|uniref:type ISP restriction/modification enzyme n=1 Tax=Streptomyces sp. NPDC001985 TaxID=3154406 RepID=UPI00331CFC23
MPMLDELMPWGVRPLRLGRSWVMGPDARSLVARWDAVAGASGAAQDALFGCTRARTPRTAVAQLPGQRAGTGPLAREPGRCPAPVRLLHGPFDQRWIVPDHRLIDAARPELWRVADEEQLFAFEAECSPDGERPGPAVLVSAVLPDGHTGPGRVRPLFRRPGGSEPNLAPGLREALGGRYGRTVEPEEILRWIAAAAGHSPAGATVPLPADPGVWRAGVELGGRLLSAQLRGAGGRERPRLPGGRRPYVRAALPERPGTIGYDPATEVLSLGDGRISPVPASAWEFRTGDARVLERWFAGRTAAGEQGSLEAIRPAGWLPEWTSELLELITVLALLAGLEAERAALEIADRITSLPGVLPPPAAARRPASVLDHHEEGPDGQFALL